MMSIWQSIPVDEALDMLQFWVDANWPMTEREAAELSSEVGWTQDQDGWVSNDRFGLSFPDVEGIGPADDAVKRIMLTLTDHEKHVTDDFARFIAGRFAEYVDGAEKRWGKGALRRGEVDRAYFDLESRGGVMIVRSKVVEALYLTQPEVDLRKANKEWAA